MSTPVCALADLAPNSAARFVVDVQTVISRDASTVKVLVVPTDEERMIALHTLDVLHDRKG